MLFRETFPVGPFACNCSIVACDVTKEAVVIDPGGDEQRIHDVLAHYGFTVKSILHTHAHLDHIHGTRAVKEKHGGTICLHQDDLFLYDGIHNQAAMFGWRVQDTLPVDHYLEHGESIPFGDNAAVTIHTPGHTPGSMCFAIQDGTSSILFSGDTLFRRSIGRTDLPGGNTQQLYDSIKTQLYTRDPASLVVPGHGPNTTLEEEAAKNPFVTA